VTEHRVHNWSSQPKSNAVVADSFRESSWRISSS